MSETRSLDNVEEADRMALSEMHAEFQRSKAELIQRFLRDQDELNMRFEEYELHSDDEDSRNHRRKPGLDLQTVLEDLEDISVQPDLDNLSTASAVNSSAGSLGELEGSLDSAEEKTACKFPSEDYSQPIREQKPNPKSKKVLTKKSVRPQTAMGMHASSRPWTSEGRHGTQSAPSNTDSTRCKYRWNESELSSSVNYLNSSLPLQHNVRVKSSIYPRYSHRTRQMSTNSVLLASRNSDEPTDNDFMNYTSCKSYKKQHESRDRTSYDGSTHSELLFNSRTAPSNLYSQTSPSSLYPRATPSGGIKSRTAPSGLNSHTDPSGVKSRTTSSAHYSRDFNDKSVQDCRQNQRTNRRRITLVKLPPLDSARSTLVEPATQQATTIGPEFLAR